MAPQAKVKEDVATKSELDELKARIEAAELENARLSERETGVRDIKMEASTNAIREFLSSDHPETDWYIVSKGPSQRNIVLVNESVDSNNRTIKKELRATFSSPMHNIGRDLDGIYVLYWSPITKSKNVSITKKEVDQGYFEFRENKIAIPKDTPVREFDDGYSLADAFDGLWRKPNKVRKQVMSGNELREYLRPMYEAKLAAREAEEAARKQSEGAPIASWKTGQVAGQ